MKRRSAHPIFVTLFLILLAPAVLSAQTTLPVAFQTVLDTNGNPISGAQVEVFEAGTVVHASTYSDSALTVPNAWPIVADSAGRFVAFVPSGQSFKVTFKTAAGVVIKTVDGVAAIPSSTGNLDVPGVAGEALSAGDVVYLSDGSGGLVAGKWYQADADNTYSSTLPTVGVVPEGIALNATGTVRLAGKVSDLPAVVVGSTYYISAVAGGMTAVAPANTRLLGSADTATSLVLQINTAAATVPMSALTGAWTAVAYNAADFTQSGAGTWAVDAADVKTLAYQIRGKSMLIVFEMWQTDTAAAMGAYLKILIPAAKTANRIASAVTRISDAGGAYAAGYVTVAAGGTTLNLYKMDGSNWTATAGDNTYVQGQIEIEIQ